MGGHKQSEETRRKISKARKGMVFSEETRIKMSMANKGKKPWNTGKKMTAEHNKMLSEAHKGLPSGCLGYKHSKEARENMSKARLGKKPRNFGTKGLMNIWNKGMKYDKDQKMKLNLSGLKHSSGEKNNRWKGGITPENAKIRNSLEIKLRRKASFERDNFTCQKCKVNGGYLCAHHINNFADFPELRTAIDNGVTLCKKCHDGFHGEYGRKNNTREQLEDYINELK